VIGTHPTQGGGWGAAQQSSNRLQRLGEVAWSEIRQIIPEFKQSFEFKSCEHTLLYLTFHEIAIDRHPSAFHPFLNTAWSFLKNSDQFS
jgi:hypothetical protein